MEAAFLTPLGGALGQLHLTASSKCRSRFPVSVVSPPSPPPPTPPSRWPPPSRPNRHQPPSDKTSSSSSPSSSLRLPVLPERPEEDAIVQPIVGRRALTRALYRAGSAEGVNLVVLYCRAAWCRSCATLAPKVARIAIQAKEGAFDFGSDVAWHSMDIVEEANRTLTKEIGAEMLPTFAFFRPADLSALPYADTDGLIPGGDETAQAEADREAVSACFERKFIAGPFGASRLQQNLEDVLSSSED